MIKILGTSHISPESIESIKETIKEYDPDVVALELDPLRLQTLLQGDQGGRRSYGSVFLMLFSKVQEWLGRKTGITPGGELVQAFREADGRGIPVALIDQDIRVTLDQLKQIPLKEKVKLGGMLAYGLFFGVEEEVDLRSVPATDFIRRSLARIKVMFPNLYRVLIEDRNRFMASRIVELDYRFDNVLAVVGAGHVDGLEELVREAVE